MWRWLIVRLRALRMALGLYTVLPGCSIWTDEAVPLLPVMLPPVGAVLGLLWVGGMALSHLLPDMLGSLLVAAAMPLMTGFLHLDGLMDCADALLSSRTQEEKLRILKDAHTGAFAVISVALYLFTMLAAADGVRTSGVQAWLVAPLPVVSRAVAAMCLMCIAPLDGSGYGKMNYAARTSAKCVACAGMLALAILAAACLDIRCAVAAVFCMMCAGACTWRAVRSLGGMNGDIAGLSIACGEMAGLVALAVL